ncbi:glycosyltransferase family 4 protein [Synechococcus sp. J7-Johnson]|nr:glycosyltransferase family 4 protein [Synechococcus sp. J7-Johnson]
MASVTVSACLALLSSGAASWLLLRWMIPRLQRHLLDLPNVRSAHAVPTPRGGGLAIVLVTVMTSLIAEVANWSSPLATLPFFCAPLALVGLLDDRFDLPAGFRYAVQLLTSFMLLSLAGLSLFVLPLAVRVIVFLLLVIAITAVINFTNFMDGLDGLVAGCLTIAFIAGAVELAAPWSFWSVVGALLGFLVWNWSPAKVFLGDVGSTFLGAMFAGIVLLVPSWPSALGLLLVATPLFADAFVCVLRRLMAGHKIFQAHRLHLFQRLHQAGWPQAHIAIIYISGTSALALAFLVGDWRWVMAGAALEVLFGFWLDQHVAVPFSVTIVSTKNTRIPH